MRTLMSLLVLGAVGLAPSAWAASDADCQAEFKRADRNNDGVLSQQESARYAAQVRVGGRSASDDAPMTRDAFMDACKADLFAEHKNDAGAPLKGSNSFTEGQAKDRAVARGYESVSGLKKDDEGIWRGTAVEGGKQVQIAVDYKGNVVSTAQQ